MRLSHRNTALPPYLRRLGFSRFRIFFIFSARGGERGMRGDREGEGGVSVFKLKIPRGGGGGLQERVKGRGGREGVCGEFGGGGGGGG